MITINDVTYEEADLTPEAIANVARVNELRQELNSHQMRVSELNVLISAYANAIKASVEVVEEEAVEA
jgi:methylphosphotriester-DNA--protein-cysteine methyltransferase|tara:strand:- start:736 stop:939 length:204 start_codon:yes stop_codon:yes gene_type:complete